MDVIYRNATILIKVFLGVFLGFNAAVAVSILYHVVFW